MNYKFLVTGATGFIGKRVVALLLEKNIEVIATDINQEKGNFLPVQFQQRRCVANVTGLPC